MKQNTPFDRIASHYEELHNRFLPAGVRSADFVEHREYWVDEWQQQLLPSTGVHVMDFGCGTGRLLKLLSSKPWCGSITGVDESLDSLKEAESQLRESGCPVALYESCQQIPLEVRFDLIVACNVFHHIDPQQRLATVSELSNRLTETGILAVWEHNPWNPLTRHLVRICPFDRGVVLMSRRNCLRSMSRLGLQKRSSRYVLPVPPRWIRRSRFAAWLEKRLGGLLVGAQYFVLASKSAG